MACNRLRITSQRGLSFNLVGKPGQLRDSELCKERLPVFWLARCSALLDIKLAPLFIPVNSVAVLSANYLHGRLKA